MKYRIKKVGDSHIPEVEINGEWGPVTLKESILLSGFNHSEENARLIIERHKYENIEPEYIYIDDDKNAN